MMRINFNVPALAVVLSVSAFSGVTNAAEGLSPEQIVASKLRADKSEEDARALKAEADREEAEFKLYKIRRDKQLLMMADSKLGINVKKRRKAQAEENSSHAQELSGKDGPSFAEINAALHAGKTTDKDGDALAVSSGLVGDVTKAAHEEEEPHPIEYMCATKIFGKSTAMKADVWMQGSKYPSLSVGDSLPNDVKVVAILVGDKGWGVTVKNKKESRRLAMCSESDARDMGYSEEMDFEIAEPL